MKNFIAILCLILTFTSSVFAGQKEDKFYQNTIVPVILQELVNRSTINARQSMLENKLVHYTKMDGQEFYIVYVKFKVEVKKGIPPAKTDNIIDTVIIAQGLIFVVKDNHIENVLVLSPEILEETSGFMSGNFEFEI